MPCIIIILYSGPATILLCPVTGCTSPPPQPNAFVNFVIYIHINPRRPHISDLMPTIHNNGKKQKQDTIKTSHIYSTYKPYHHNYIVLFADSKLELSRVLDGAGGTGNWGWELGIWIYRRNYNLAPSLSAKKKM